VEARDFKCGQRVVYIPAHVEEGDLTHRDVEHGEVTAVGLSSGIVFVRFDGESYSKACSPGDLQHETQH
jgi:hypothetical protein